MFKYSKLPDNLQFVKMREFADHYPDAYAWIVILDGRHFLGLEEDAQAYVDAWIKAECDVIDSCDSKEFLTPEMKKLLENNFVINPQISYLIKISYNQNKNDFECSLCYNDDNEIIIRKWENENK